MRDRASFGSARRVAIGVGIAAVSAGLIAIPAVAQQTRPGEARPGAGEARPGASEARPGASEAIPLEPRTRDVQSGFRMEGAAELELVFGDTASYREQIDRFYTLHEQLEQERERFGRAAHSAIRALVAHDAAERRGCPADRLAAPHAEAERAFAAFRALGRRLEAEYRSIHERDVLGDTAALTPQYRWRVNRARELYRAARRDLREIRVVFAQQLASELRARRCALPDPATVSLEAAAPAPPSATRPAVVAAAAPVTFAVDNRACRQRLALVVDGVALGEVAAGSEAVFQTLSGRHEMCLLPVAGGAECGTPGTVRSAHIHDGWTIAVDCE